MELSSNEDEDFTSSFIRFDHLRPPSSTPGDTQSNTPDTSEVSVFDDPGTREIPETPQWDSVTKPDGENDTTMPDI